ncbi:helix-turn-helix domain-containing protein [Niabella beijingensis]|uniref:helix-turn-helix domain-containing protein n=1 Tax=Niabella beijingensis TaxID=2872700 RepID=UPI001CBFE6D0|nr:AraC family transcriptional regulator [Niabella beijingensis]MBZ4191917.1 AraC family transcriptional regulator [Niabella beijingensis]
MVKVTMHGPLEVVRQNMEAVSTVDFRNNFFQICLVVTGQGHLGVGCHRTAFRSGSVILLTPDDVHHFELEQPTEFLMVRFSSSYVRSFEWGKMNQMECILYYARHFTGCIMRTPDDNVLVRSIATSLLHTLEHPDLYQEDIVKHFVNALIVIAARNIEKAGPPAASENTDKKLLDIIHYIEEHIFDPAKLKAAVIGRAFGVSAGYIGQYFRRCSGETLQHFITQYKLRLIEHRLKFSDMRVHEIALEFGFTDESHLNKYFKKQKGVALTKYRKLQASKIGKREPSIIED